MSNLSAAAAADHSPVVDLVYDADCPHVGDARLLLRRALTEAGLRVQWLEWRRDAVDTPPALRGFGSPTILVHGVDVAEDGSTTRDTVAANACRVYRQGDRLQGVPALDAVTRALMTGERA